MGRGEWEDWPTGRLWETNLILRPNLSREAMNSLGQNHWASRFALQAIRLEISSAEKEAAETVTGMIYDK